MGKIKTVKIPKKRPTKKKPESPKVNPNHPVKLNYRLLYKLIDAPGISGHEEVIRKIISTELKKYVDKVIIDNSGNLIGHKKGTKPRVMLAAHMDEVGLIVKKISEDGKIYCSAIGGIEPMSIVGDRVSIHAKKNSIDGIITTTDISRAVEIVDVPYIDDIFIDTGLYKKELIEKGVEIGSYVDLKRSSGALGSTDIVSGKSLDDRLGCYIMLELAKRLKKTKYEIYFTFTVQEEIGIYGAKTSAYKIEPDLGIAIDTTGSDDFNEIPTTMIGFGPCITVKDSDMIANRQLNDLLKQVAQKNEIPIQLEVSDMGTTDALSISISKGGVPSTHVGVPVRNIHTAVGISHAEDIRNAILLLESFLKKIPKMKPWKM